MIPKECKRLAEVDGTSNLEAELRLILKDLDLADRVRVENL